MSTETYTFHGDEREDGLLYITSPDLPGFRLVLGPDDHDQVEREIYNALKIFYPAYKAAKARANAEALRPLVGERRFGPTGKGFNVSAQMAFA